ncbi:hypothetical protein IFM58399_08685 [Aspergillus lentulus]|uniref:uncharacterized protein n=1 Tax=Aspergillus lentulus TaxID=293939 RepID=UPI0013940745|nr:uncharacterized protein IFM58399_08685 [Aspergillus lentulus]GFF49954.1 hypothetical protein IFM58399_08685 [Aspergillus lentulus]
MISSPAASRKPTILTLPQELRDIIIEYSFLERDPVSIELPNYPTPSPPREKRFEGTKYASHGQRLLHYPLLLVNHQFRSEGWEVLNKLAASRYEADIVFFQRQRLILFMPTQKFPTRFKHARAKFYVLKDDGTRPIESWYFKYRSVSGGALRDCWDLYRVLQRFLQCGPPNATHAPADAHILIETLELDVRTRTGIPENLLGPPNITTEDRRFVIPRTQRPRSTEIGRLLDLIKETGVDYKMHPDYLVCVLHELLQLLLFYHDGRMIYERVGVLRLLLDGGRVHEWNLDECLKGMYCKEEEHAKWRRFALAHRSQIGFRHLTTRHEEALV